MIGDDVIITVLNIDSSQVRLGIEAPADIAVDRQEIRAKKEAGPVSGNGW